MVAVALAAVLLAATAPSFAARYFDASFVDRVDARHGTAAGHRAQKIVSLVAQLRDDDPEIVLERVNDLVNRHRYRSDEALWGRRDHWATPAQFLARNGGDCEDFAIIKYFMLRDLGIADERLSITHVRWRGDAHVVLLYRDEAGVTQVLDSLRDAIEPLAQRRDLRPVYGVNTDAALMVPAAGPAWHVIRQADRRPRHWARLLHRVSLDGFQISRRR